MDEMTLRQAQQREDGARMWSLVKACPPLDLNTPYCYLMWARNFPNTTILAQAPGSQDLVGLITANILPDRPDTLFIWQVATHSSMRGRGLAGTMIDTLLSWPACSGLRFIETTVSPSNQASRRIFEKCAQRLNGDLTISTCFTEQDFPADGGSHESEELLRIGPIVTTTGATHVPDIQTP